MPATGTCCGQDTCKFNNSGCMACFETLGCSILDALTMLPSVWCAARLMAEEMPLHKRFAGHSSATPILLNLVRTSWMLLTIYTAAQWEGVLSCIAAPFVVRRKGAGNNHSMPGGQNGAS